MRCGERANRLDDVELVTLLLGDRLAQLGEGVVRDFLRARDRIRELRGQRRRVAAREEQVRARQVAAALVGRAERASGGGVASATVGAGDEGCSSAVPWAGPTDFPSGEPAGGASYAPADQLWFGVLAAGRRGGVYSTPPSPASRKGSV